MSIPGNANPLLLASAAAADAAAAGPIKSLRFNSADSAYLNRTPSSAGNRRTFTFACWIKRAGLGASHVNIFAAGSNRFRIALGAGDGHLQVYEYDGNNFNFNKGTGALFRDPSAWYHLVVAIDTTDATAADRVKVYVNGSRITDFSTSDGNPSQNLDTFVNNTSNVHYIGTLGDSSNYLDAYLADVYFIDGSALDASSFGAFDDSGVWQAAAYSGTFGTNGFHLFDFASESTVGHDSSGNENDFTANNINSGATTYSGSATATASPSGSSMIVKAVGSSVTGTFNAGGGTGGNINYYSSSDGVSWSYEETSTGESSSFTAKFLSMGGGSNNSRQFTATSGSFEYSVAGSTSLDSNSSTVTVAQTQLFANSNLDVLFDVPTNGNSSDDSGAGGEVSGNYATLNANTGYPWTLSNGNLECTAPTSPSSGHCPATIFVNSGKWYAEVTTVNNTDDHAVVGVVKLGAPTNNRIGNNGGAGWEPERDRKRAIDGTTTSPFFNVTYTDNVITLGLALDMDDGTLDIYVNGSLVGELISGLSGYYTFAVGDTVSSQQPSYKINFGQRPFAYSAPSGFKTLCTANLPTPTIAQGKDYFNAVLYTGTGSNPRAVTGVGHSSDFVWIKARNAAAGHAIMDSVRGTGTNALASHTTSAEGTETYGQMSSFDSDGFTVTFSSNGEQNVNFNNRTYVAWSWEAASSTASNTDGSITSSVRANTSAGMSVVGFTGNGSAATIGHGLNAAPELILLKNRQTTQLWYAYSKELGAAKYLYLNQTDGAVSDVGMWNNVEPTSSVFTVGSYALSNNYIAYCFTPVAGYSAMGSYTGNGSSANGTFVWTGFRPRWVLIKATSIAGQSWYILDAARDPHNLTANKLEANSANSENASPNTATTNSLDFLSNGFKLRTSNDGTNQSSATYIYFAIAENPFQANGGLAR
jgi:hypothetical protein|tara:strand:+ start:423 stop:3206 length:2784 start_codon:yes stop_codon:yes gene_type:complete